MRDPRDADVTDDVEVAFSAIQATLGACYGNTLSRTNLSPLEALAQIAAALGGLYRTVADAHQRLDGCQCGWEPDVALDLAGLHGALASAAHPGGSVNTHDLLTMSAAGNG